MPASHEKEGRAFSRENTTQNRDCRLPNKSVTDYITCDFRDFRRGRKPIPPMWRARWGAKSFPLCGQNSTFFRFRRKDLAQHAVARCPTIVRRVGGCRSPKCLKIRGCLIARFMGSKEAAQQRASKTSEFLTALPTYYLAFAAERRIPATLN